MPQLLDIKYRMRCYSSIKVATFLNDQSSLLKIHKHTPTLRVNRNAID